MIFPRPAAIAVLVGATASCLPRDAAGQGAPERDPANQTAGGLDEPGAALAEFARHFSGHEPIYVLAGPDSPNVKFQVSFKYAILNPQAPLVETVPALAGVNIAYTQTSFWDTADESAPFFDSSYKPEVLWSDENIPALGRPGRYGLGLQFGAQHESNGKPGDDSRSLNIAYLRPILTLGDVTDFHISIAPRVFAYFGSQWGNADIEDFRGYADLRVKGGWREGLELSALGRLGDDWDHGSLQLDLTYPLRNLLSGNLDVYLDVQGFYGYGETLREYNERTSALRVGIAVVR